MKGKVVDAVVLAGGTLKSLATDENVATKALVDINGRPMLAYVLDALRGSKRIEKIMVLLPSSVPRASWTKKVDLILPGDGSLSENFYAGLSKVDSNKKVLVVSADIPMLTSEAVDDFLDRCEEIDASVYYPIVSKATIEKKYPHVERTYMTLHEGKFTGGNLFLVDPRAAIKNKELLRKVIEARKSPFKLIQILGLSFIIKFIFHRLTVKDLEEKVSDLIGAKGVAVNTSYVEISIDVDKDSDLELMREKLTGGSEAIEKDYHN